VGPVVEGETASGRPRDSHFFSPDLDNNLDSPDNNFFRTVRGPEKPVWLYG
jgi:hypothetical protein